MKYNVLVTGTSSYGVGEGILKTVNQSTFRKNINLIAASNSILTAFRFLADKYYMLPNAADEEYIKSLVNLAVKENIHIVIPGSEAEVKALSKNKKYLLENYKIDVWVNDYEIVEIFDDKLIAEEFFNKYGITTPESYNNSSKKYPLIIKPVNGKSSEGIFIINNEEQYRCMADYYNANDKQFIAQEYIEKDTEYTISLINLDDGIEILIMERILNKGASQYSRIINNCKIFDITKKIHEIVKKELILNIQMLTHKEMVYVIEINPRFSGSSPMRAKLGFNEFDIIFSHKYLNKKYKYVLEENAYCIRGYEEIIYSDDFDAPLYSGNTKIKEAIEIK